MPNLRTAATSLGCLAMLTLTFGCSGGLSGKEPNGPGDDKPRNGGKDKNEPQKGEDVTAPTGTEWTHVTIPNAKKRNAVCNNGAPATYFFVEGKGDGADDWIIFLKGGGGCGTVEECQERMESQAGLMKPTGAKRAPESEGLMSGNASKNPDFHNWNRVFVPYCSSDSWMGDMGASDKNGNFEFRGSRIVDAVIEDLRDDGLPGTDRKIEDGRVLFTGGSAGAMGMRMNIDRVAAALPKTKWVKGVGDGFIVPARTPTKEMETAVRFRYHEMQGSRPDDSCVAAVGDKNWECTETRNIRKYVETPIFTYMDVMDSNLFGRFGVEKGTKEGRELAEEIRAELVKLGPGVFSSAKGYHVVVATDRFADLKVNLKGKDLTYAEVLGNWVFDRSGPKECVPTR